MEINTQIKHDEIQQIQRDVEEFIKRGGRITRVDTATERKGLNPANVRISTYHEAIAKLLS